MARLARVVLPDCWHHVTQRGNHRQEVFPDDASRRFYLEVLRHQCEKYAVRLGGYCLMGNHVHLLAIPARANSLAGALGRTHNDYARWLNLRCGRTGHLWQNRFYSCAMDEAHRWDALRYVELNPVRAGLARYATDWEWSSAQAHCSGLDRLRLLDWSDWFDRWTPITWNDVLEHGVDDVDLLSRIREATLSGRVAGDEEFLAMAERALGRSLRPKKRGPRAKTAVPESNLSFEVA